MTAACPSPTQPAEHSLPQRRPRAHRLPSDRWWTIQCGTLSRLGRQIGQRQEVAALRVQRDQRGRYQGILRLARIALIVTITHQAGSPQEADVMGDGALRQVQNLNQVAGT